MMDGDSLPAFYISVEVLAQKVDFVGETPWKHGLDIRLTPFLKTKLVTPTLVSLVQVEKARYTTATLVTSAC